ncbi:MAG: hypothetical protein WKF77_30920 [Planctomycetaceae bacterium]
MAIALLTANLVPQARVAIPVFLDPSSAKLPPSNGVLQYGWPKIARVDEGIQYTGVNPISHYSLNHLWGTEKFHRQTTQTSVVTHIANGVFGVALVLVSALVTRLIATRKPSLKSAFVVVTLVGVLFASSGLGVTLSISEPMAGSLRWTADFNDVVHQNPELVFTVPL